MSTIPCFLLIFLIILFPKKRGVIGGSIKSFKIFFGIVLILAISSLGGYIWLRLIKSEIPNSPILAFMMLLYTYRYNRRLDEQIKKEKTPTK